ncbi:MAG: carbonic anhydrase family protein [Myxococcota bacterium]
MRMLVSLTVVVAMGCSSSAPPPAPSSKGAGYLDPEAGPGVAQSPINIVTSQATEKNEQVLLHYGRAQEKVVNLGHTIEVDLSPGSWVMDEDKRFVLRQFHFHTPSEHLIDGITFPMEMHMVHTLEGEPHEYLVIAVLFRQGSPSPFIDAFADQIPQMAGEESPAGVIDLSAICDPEEGFFKYRGSLTTPPYTETVRWLISKKVHEASPEQVDTIHRLEGDNARHIQIFGERRIEDI